jgi:hypothetical protein
MTRIAADFSTISHEFTPMPNDDYICIVDTVEEGKTKGNPDPKTGLPKSIKDQVHFIYKVKDSSKPDFEDREIHDFLVLQKDNGQPNKISLGRIKAVAIAVLGEVAANSPDGIDPQELKGGTVLVTTRLEPYKKKDEATGIETSGVGTRAERVSPVK